MSVSLQRWNGEPLLLGDSVASGGEAYVHKAEVDGKTCVVKRFRLPDDKLFLTREARDLAALRVSQHQQKLVKLQQTALPKEVVKPVELIRLAADYRWSGGVLAAGTIIGYGMEYIENAVPLSQYAQFDYREKHKINNNMVVSIFLKIHAILSELHRKLVIVGDLNDSNILIKNGEAFLIDVDTFQIDVFTGINYTPDYLDPELFLGGKRRKSPSTAYTPESDWVAYTRLLWECLMRCGAFSGALKHTSGPFVSDAERVLGGLWVGHSAVTYPQDSPPISVLPQSVQAEFEEHLEGRKRGIFTRSLLEKLKWQQCSSCSLEHAVSACPDCLPNAQTIRKVRGYSSQAPSMVSSSVTLSAKSLFRCTGNILDGAFNSRTNTIDLLVRDGKRILRYSSGSETELGRNVAKSDWIEGAMISGDASLIWGQNSLVRYEGPSKLTIGGNHFPDRGALGHSLIASGGIDHYVISNSELYRRFSVYTKLSSVSKPIRLWAGHKRAVVLEWEQAPSGFLVRLVEESRMVSEVSLNVPGIGRQDQLKAVEASLTENATWIFMQFGVGRRLVNYAFVILSDGEILATGKEENNSQSWLGSLYGKFAIEREDIEGLRYPGLLSLSSNPARQVSVYGDAIIEDVSYRAAPLINVPVGGIRVAGQLFIVGTQELSKLAIA